MKKKNTRLALFVRVKKANKEFIEKETEKEARASGQYVTNQNTVDRVVAGYRRLKKTNPIIAARFFS